MKSSVKIVIEIGKLLRSSSTGKMLGLDTDLTAPIEQDSDNSPVEGDIEDDNMDSVKQIQGCETADSPAYPSSPHNRSRVEPFACWEQARTRDF